MLDVQAKKFFFSSLKYDTFKVPLALFLCVATGQPESTTKKKGLTLRKIFVHFFFKLQTNACVFKALIFFFNFIFKWIKSFSLATRENKKFFSFYFIFFFYKHNSLYVFIPILP